MRQKSTEQWSIYGLHVPDFTEDYNNNQLVYDWQVSSS